MKKIQLGEFEEVVLLTVGVLHGNAYGVTIKHEIEQRLDRDIAVGALQVTLRRLESKGFLKSRQGESSDNRRGRPRLFFEITAYGKKALVHTKETRDELWNDLPKLALGLNNG
jgi:PadR family transcriptional regulator, regulatory protein PadR